MWVVALNGQSRDVVREVLDGAKLRETSRTHGISKTTLSRYAAKGIPESYKEKYHSKHVSTQVFTHEE
ncbi:hypothetical protein NQ318_023562 [Aromia moschata]|uniref:HTH psq-type domain-containing protein n=1 Tax=Aromia moschata TaxID=1265417 RepID=A0AAV8YQ11_9CUCU|nr:hypothetical protein NQ318_023562 [Aromia moschata]